MGNRLDVIRLLFSRQTGMSVSHPMINKLVELDGIQFGFRKSGSTTEPCA